MKTKIGDKIRICFNSIDPVRTKVSDRTFVVKKIVNGVVVCRESPWRSKIMPPLFAARSWVRIKSINSVK